MSDPLDKLATIDNLHAAGQPDVAEKRQRTAAQIERDRLARDASGVVTSQQKPARWDEKAGAVRVEPKKLDPTVRSRIQAVRAQPVTVQTPGGAIEIPPDDMTLDTDESILMDPRKVIETLYQTGQDATEGALGVWDWAYEGIADGWEKFTQPGVAADSLKFGTAEGVRQLDKFFSSTETQDALFGVIGTFVSVLEGKEAGTAQFEELKAWRDRQIESGAATEAREIVGEGLEDFTSSVPVPGGGTLQGIVDDFAETEMPQDGGWMADMAAYMAQTLPTAIAGGTAGLRAVAPITRKLDAATAGLREFSGIGSAIGRLSTGTTSGVIKLGAASQGPALAEFAAVSPDEVNLFEGASEAGAILEQDPNALDHSPLARSIGQMWNTLPPDARDILVEMMVKQDTDGELAKRARNAMATYPEVVTELALGLGAWAGKGVMRRLNKLGDDGLAAVEEAGIAAEARAAARREEGGVTLTSGVDPEVVLDETVIALGKAAGVARKLKGTSKPETGDTLPVRRSDDDPDEVLDAQTVFGRVGDNETVPITELKGGTVGTGNDAARVAELVEAMKGPDGYISRLIVDQDGNVIEGQHRLEALRELGVTNVPVTRIIDYTQAYDTVAIAQAAKGKGIHPDQANQIARYAIEAIEDADGDVARAIEDNEMPLPYRDAFQAAVTKAGEVSQADRNKLKPRTADGDDDAFPQVQEASSYTAPGPTPVERLGRPDAPQRSPLASVRTSLGERMSWLDETGDTPDRVAQRLPSDPQPDSAVDNTLRADMASMYEGKAAANKEQHTKRIKEYPGVKGATKGLRKADSVISAYKNHVKENLRWVYNQVDPEIRERSSRWYDGGRALIDFWSQRYDVPDRVPAAMLAVLSPSTDWYSNVSMAERMLDILSTRQDFAPDAKMNSVIDAIYAGKSSKSWTPEDVEIVRSGSLRDMPSDHHAAMWIRAYDEAHNPRKHRVLSPEGRFVGQPSTTTTWQSIPAIAKAVEAYRDPHPEKIARTVGAANKVRNFYNNLIAPNAARHGDVTIDTHAVAVAQLRPLSNSAPAVMHNFGLSPNKKKKKIPEDWTGGVANNGSTGSKGLYGIYADAYRELAEELGIQPRQLQSITWEAVREFFPTQGASKGKMREQVDAVWSEFDKGKLTREEVYDRINTLTGGFNKPSWARPDTADDVSSRQASYDGGVSGTGIRDAGGDGAGGRAIARSSLFPEAGSTARARERLASFRPGTDEYQRWRSYLETFTNAIRPGQNRARSVNEGLARPFRSAAKDRPVDLNIGGTNFMFAPVERYRPSGKMRETILAETGGDESAVFDMVEVPASSAEAFVAALEKFRGSTPFATSVYTYPVEEYRKMKLLMADDGSAGLAIKEDGDIVSLFSDGSKTMPTLNMLALAVMQGGRKLDAFDTILPHTYSRSGFKVASRLPFDDSQAPDGWDYDLYKAYNDGRPDRVFMTFDPTFGRPYIQGEGSLSKNYDGAVKKQVKEIERLSGAGVFRLGAVPALTLGGLAYGAGSANAALVEGERQAQDKQDYEGAIQLASLLGRTLRQATKEARVVQDGNPVTSVIPKPKDEPTNALSFETLDLQAEAARQGGSGPPATGDPAQSPPPVAGAGGGPDPAAPPQPPAAGSDASVGTGAVDPDPRDGEVTPVTNVTEEASERVRRSIEQERANAEAGGKPPEEVFNFDRWETEADVQNAVRKVAEEFEASELFATRGSRTFQQEIEDAKTDLSHFGNVARRVLDRKQGETFNASQMLAAREMLVASSQRLDTLAQAANSGADADILAFHRHLGLHAQLQNQVKGAQTEIARALSAFRIPVGGPETQLDGTMRAFEQLGGIENARAAVDYYNKLPKTDGTGGVRTRAAFASSLGSKYGRAAKISKDMFYSAYINGLLSGPATHLLNAGSNILFNVWRMGERQFAGVLPGTGVEPGEAAMMWFATQAAMMDMSRMAGRYTLGKVSGDPNIQQEAKDIMTALADIGLHDQTSKIEARDDQRVFTSGYVGIPRGPLAKAFDVFGVTVEWPGMALGASDGFFKTIAYRQELYARAFRQARHAVRLGMPEDDARALMIDTIMNPPDDINVRAMDYARQTTFTSQLGKSGQALQQLISTEHPLGMVLKYFMPFVKTPTNVLKQGIARAPGIGFGQSALPRQYNRPERQRGDRGLEFSQALLSNLLMGGMGLMMYGGYNEDDNGKPLVTGGQHPDWKQNRQDELMTGIPNYAARVPFTNHYMEYQRIEPLSIPMSIMADMMEFSKYNVEGELPTEILKTAGSAVVNSMKEKAFLSGFSTLTEVLNNPDQGLTQALKSMVSPLITLPYSSLIRRYASAQDDVQRNSNVDIPTDVVGNYEYTEDGAAAARIVRDGVLNQWKRNIPAMMGFKGRQSLPERLDPLGEPIKQGTDSFMLDFASPLFFSEIQDNVLGNKLRDLQWDLPQPPTELGGVKLTEAEKYKYLKLRGQGGYTEADRYTNGLKVRMMQILQSEEFNKYPPDVQREILDGEMLKMQGRYDSRNDKITPGYKTMLLFDKDEQGNLVPSDLYKRIQRARQQEMLKMQLLQEAG